MPSSHRFAEELSRVALHCLLHALARALKLTLAAFLTPFLKRDLSEASRSHSATYRRSCEIHGLSAFV